MSNSKATHRQTTTTPAVPAVDFRTNGHEAAAVRPAERPRHSNDAAYLRLHLACSQRGILVQYTVGPRITEPTVKRVAGVVTYYVPKSWDLQDAQNRLPGLHDGFTARESADRYIAANHPHVDALLHEGAREHREPTITGPQLSDMEYSDEFTTAEVDAAARTFRAQKLFAQLRVDADPKLNEAIDLAIEVIGETGDPQEFGEWFLAAIKARR
ncbi:hypothetical protein [Streptomyces sp. NPDC002547]